MRTGTGSATPATTGRTTRPTTPTATVCHRAFPGDPDNDSDGDEIGGDTGNCPGYWNPGQEDGDGDGKGTPCDDANSVNIDDTAPPTKVAACKKGKWATYDNPSFSSQSACTRYVNRK